MHITSHTTCVPHRAPQRVPRGGDPDNARRCLRAERITLGALALVIAVLFALGGHGAAPVPTDAPTAPPAFGWPI